MGHQVVGNAVSGMRSPSEPSPSAKVVAQRAGNQELRQYALQTSYLLWTAKTQ